MGHVSLYNSSALGHLHETLSQFFIILLKVVRLSLDVMWYRSNFQILGPRCLILLAPKVT